MANAGSQPSVFGYILLVDLAEYCKDRPQLDFGSLQHTCVVHSCSLIRQFRYADRLFTLVNPMAANVSRICSCCCGVFVSRYSRTASSKSSRSIPQTWRRASHPVGKRGARRASDRTIRRARLKHSKGKHVHLLNMARQQQYSPSECPAPGGCNAGALHPCQIVGKTRRWLGHSWIPATPCQLWSAWQLD